MPSAAWLMVPARKQWGRSHFKKIAASTVVRTYVPIGRSTTNRSTMKRRAALRRCTMWRLYKAEFTCSWSTFYARSDSEIAWAPYSTDFAASTRFVETMIRHILFIDTVVECRYLALHAFNKALLCSFIGNRRWCRVLGLMHVCSIGTDSHRVGTLPISSSVSNSDFYELIEITYKIE